jgi:exodeoxyribonuclease VII large subunit
MVSPSPVQGVDAPPQLVQALQALAAMPEVEVILLVRGGGSMEDLWAFNDEHLAHAIVNSPVPVISGVGHETDVTIADLCADLRAPTPTAAAELCAVPRESLAQDLAAIQAFMDAELTQAIDNRSQSLDRLQSVLARPSIWANKQQHNLSQCFSRLGRAGQQVLNRQAMALEPQAIRLTRASQDVPAQMGQRLSRAALLLGSLDPGLVLQRGYAWLENTQGQAIASVQEVKVGEKLHARMADGVADMQVLATHRH